ncbi:MAG TPA: hypothetical protein VFC24_12810 [Casimicrobiaceae bacterium]|nr:hypothetical protein [Casimicrobiaceae bacterium]
MAGALPTDLQRFIVTSVPSVPFVEALLLFRTAPEARPVSATMLRQRLYINEAEAAKVIRDLEAVGAIEETAPASAAYRYAPATPGLAASLDALAKFYTTHLIEVSQLIHSTNARRATQFADAFRMRKDG